MAKKSSVPIATRRLTKAEAKLLGVSYTAKRQVPISIKKVTKRTKIFTLRQVRQAKYGTTVEKQILLNKIRKHSFWQVIPTESWFDNLKNQPNDILHKMADAESSEDWDDDIEDWELHEREERREMKNPFFYH